MTKHKYVLRLISSLALLSALLMIVFSSSSVSAAPAHFGPHIWQAQVGVQSSDYAIQGMVFLPHRLQINVGDSVVWRSNSDDVHTITFLPPGQPIPVFNGQDPQQTNKQGSDHYDGKTYYNSGLLSSSEGLQLATSYRLTFDVPGDYHYICLVHPSMVGIVHVRRAGTPYPHTLNDYRLQSAKERLKILTNGRKLEVKTAMLSNNRTTVTEGAGEGVIALMRFYPAHPIIHVGDTLTFTNRDPRVPHTVTFGATQGQNFSPYGNPAAFDGTAPLNSGFLGLDPHWFGQSFRITFVKAGIYTLRCDLHGYMGMIVKITVQA